MSDHETSISTYTTVFVSLMILLAVSIGAAELSLGQWAFPVAMLIATVKTSLVMLFFMHLLHSSKLTKLTIAVGLFMFATLLGITISDYFTRDWKSAAEPVYLPPAVDRYEEDRYEEE